MRAHRFAKGDVVMLLPTSRTGVLAPPGPYVVFETLPIARDGRRTYKVVSLADGHVRVVFEDYLVAAPQRRSSNDNTRPATQPRLALVH